MTEPVGQVVDVNPIVNDPFTEPGRHWQLGGAEPELVSGRRPSGYLAPSPDGQLRITDELIPMPLVNDLRDRVRAWRADGYPGATQVTRDLFAHWFDDARKTTATRPFFAQQEAIETVAFLVEAPPGRRVGVAVPPSGEPYERWAVKMATGTGKTLVMALIIAWSGINKAANRQDARFTDVFLVVCPNLTVKDRLGGDDGLNPADPGSVYTGFDLIPPHLSGLFSTLAGRVSVLNWHQLAPREDPRRGVVQRGPESDTAYARRVLADLPRTGRVMVLNDEAHHAHRIPPDAMIGRAEKAEAEEATVWVTGLERIHRARGVLRCIDSSATPMYPGVAKSKAWTPFEWIVSDFALVDAIESGLVKIPRVPTDDNAGRAVPKYRNLWAHISKVLPKRSDDDAGSPLSAYLAEADGPLKQLAGEWEETFDRWQGAGRRVPPVMIVVCHDTRMADLLERHIAMLGEAGPQLVNTPTEGQRTVRIDSDALAKAESGENGGEAAEEVRRLVATVGKEGQPGEQVRCLVSVQMLSEGWDARNVTQILGLRAFQSQLLCEQVVGRGLRRTDYSDLARPEYVDVYGVPFQLLPFAKGGVAAPVEPPDYQNVHTVADRHELRIRFPRVAQVVPDVGDTLSVDMKAIEPVRVAAEFDPTSTWVEFDLGAAHTGMGGESQDRGRAYQNFRVQRLLYRVAARVIAPYDKPWLFPAALDIARRVVSSKVTYEPKVDPRELCNVRYLQLLTERIGAALTPGEGQERFLPALDEYAPIGSTDGLNFNSPRERCQQVTRSHLSHAVCDSGLEFKMVAVLDSHPTVEAFVKNHRLFLEIPYLYLGKSYRYRPDFVVRLTNGVSLLLEGKGDPDEKDDSKFTAARRWIAAVNTWGQLGRWEYDICYDAGKLARILQQHAATAAGLGG